MRAPTRRAGLAADVAVALAPKGGDDGQVAGDPGGAAERPGCDPVRG